MKLQLHDQTNIDYHDYGSGQPVILIHGFGGIAEIWTGQINDLITHGYRVIVYDQRNHGNSKTKNPTNIRLLIDDLAEIINLLNLDNPFLIGHSMGAAVIYGFLQFYPQIKIKGAICIDQSPKMLSNEHWKYGYLDVTETNYSEKLFEKRKVHETLHGLDDTVWQKYHDAKIQKEVTSIDNSHLLLSHVQADWRNSLLQAKIPLLLVAAKQSPYFDYHYAIEMQKNNSKYIEVKLVNNSGHDIQAEVPNVFNEIMLIFLKTH